MHPNKKTFHFRNRFNYGRLSREPVIRPSLIEMLQTSKQTSLSGLQRRTEKHHYFHLGMFIHTSTWERGKEAQLKCVLLY